MSHVIFAVTLYADFSYSTVYIPFRSSFPPGPFRIPQFCILSTPKSTLFKNSTCAIVHGWKIAPLHLIFMSVLYHTRKIVPVLYIYPSTVTKITPSIRARIPECVWHLSFSTVKLLINAGSPLNAGGYLPIVRINAGSPINAGSQLNAGGYLSIVRINAGGVY